MTEPPHVVIIGGGFGGLYAAKSLRYAPVKVTLIDRRNFHLFQPLLYQVATGVLSPGDIASPLRGVLAAQKNTWVIEADVVDIDPARRKVILRDGEVGYDFLIVSTGVSHHYFGHDEWSELAPGLKTIEDALEIRSRILNAFECAERERDPERLREWLTFVIVGGGPTGVELAGALGEMAHHTLKHDFKNFDPTRTTIWLLEGTERVLPTYPPALSAAAAKHLADLGVTVRTRAMVTDIEEGIVSLGCDGQDEQIRARTVLWAAGMKASPTSSAVAQRTGAKLDRAGRVLVERDLSVPGYPNIFVIGDLASITDQKGKPLPGVAPVAMQEGHYVARLIWRRLRGKTIRPFRYFNKGDLAVIGRNAAVADLGWTHLNGIIAWLAWVGVHIFYLIGFNNKILVMIQWAFYYFTHKRGARLITQRGTMDGRK